MPLLAAFLGSALQAVVVFFAQQFSRRVAITLGISVVFTGLVVALYATVKAIALGLVVALPDSVVIGASWILPDNTSAVIAARLAVEAACAAYRSVRVILQMGALA